MKFCVCWKMKTNDVLGKITCVHRGEKVFEPLKFDDELVNLSYKVSKEFRLCRYDKKYYLKKVYMLSIGTN